MKKTLEKFNQNPYLIFILAIYGVAIMIKDFLVLIQSFNNNIKPMETPILNHNFLFALIQVVTVIILYLVYKAYLKNKEEFVLLNTAETKAMLANCYVQLAYSNSVCAKYFLQNLNNEYGKSLLQKNHYLFKDSLECYIVAANNYSTLNDFSGLSATLDNIFNLCIPNLSIEEINNTKNIRNDLNLEKLLDKLSKKEDQGCIGIIRQINNLLYEKRKSGQ